MLISDWSSDVCSSDLNPHELLMLAAELEFGRGEQPIDDHVITLDAVVDELAVPFGADDPERRQLALADAARKLDEHLPAVIERAKRPPRGIVALDAIAEVPRVD